MRDRPTLFGLSVLLLLMALAVAGGWLLWERNARLQAGARLRLEPAYLCTLHRVVEDATVYDVPDVPTNWILPAEGLVCANHRADHEWSRIILLDGSALEGYVQRAMLVEEWQVAARLLDG